MHLRSIFLLLTAAAIAILAALNWNALAAPGLVSLGVVTFEAPLGLLMLSLTVLLGIFCLAYVLSLQGSALMETRRHTKELHAQRDLADKAEASRFTELRTFLELQHTEAQARLLTRLDTLEAHLARRADESDNATAAYVGQLEQQFRSPPAYTTVEHGSPVVRTGP